MIATQIHGRGKMDRAERVADRFIREIDDGWGEELVAKDIAKLAGYIREEYATLEAEVERLKKDRIERQKYADTVEATHVGI